MNRFRLCAGLFVVLCAIVLQPASGALAHGRTTVGDYELVIGFSTEPAYAGEPNGLDFSVTNTKTGEKVNDLAETLTAEIIFGSSKRTLTVRPQWGEDGAYTADILPTEAGDYTWHITGEINGTPLDVSMTSSETTFSAVKAKDVVAFPAADATPAELRSEAAAAAQRAQQALIVGSLGAVAGLVGLVFGLLSWRATRRAPGTVGTTAKRSA